MMHMTLTHTLTQEHKKPIVFAEFVWLYCATMCHAQVMKDIRR